MGDNLDSQLRLNHQGIEHWRQEAQRWQADADKAKEESDRVRDELSKLSRDLETRSKKLPIQTAGHVSQQGCATDRSHAKSPKHAKAKRPAKDAEAPSFPQEASERMGHALSTPAF